MYDTNLETLTRLTFQGSQNEMAVWTPDGKRLTYYSNQTGGPLNLFWQAVDGSSRPERLTTNNANHVAMSWSADGRRLAFTEAVPPDRDIWVLEMTDRKPVPFIKTSFTEGGAQFSPDSRWIAYVSNESTGQQRVLLAGGSYPRYSAGYIVYGVQGTLRAAPFDLERLQLMGPAVPVLDSVVTKDSGAADFALARDGTLVYVSGGGAAVQRTMVWVDRTGREEPVQAPERAYFSPRISPDGNRVAVDIRDQQGDVWIWDLVGRALTRLTFDPSLDQHPVWADNRRVLFASQRGGIPNVFWQTADGSGTVEQLTDTQYSQTPNVITPDGSRIVIQTASADTASDLVLMPLRAPRTMQPLVRTTFGERNAAMSPDGRWLAYDSNESGALEVYVRPFPDVDAARWQVSTAGGRTPLWSRDGRELFYVASDALLMRVGVEGGSTWRTSAPDRLIEGRYFYSNAGSARTFDVASDGRFLMVKPLATSASYNQLVIVQNWHEELKRLVPNELTSRPGNTDFGDT